jgi:hypothetical protein
VGKGGSENAVSERGACRFDLARGTTEDRAPREPEQPFGELAHLQCAEAGGDLRKGVEACKIGPGGGVLPR